MDGDGRAVWRVVKWRRRKRQGKGRQKGKAVSLFPANQPASERPTVGSGVDDRDRGYH